METTQQDPGKAHQDDAKYTKDEKPFADGKGTRLEEEFEVPDKEELERNTQEEDNFEND